MANIETQLRDVRTRWQIVPPKWDWLFPRVKLRILFYADFQNAYDGGSFDGLKDVLATLKADPYWWLTIDTDLANRGNDPSADPDKVNKTLDQLNLKNYDEVWIFGFFGGNSVLTAAEQAALKDFMDNHKGGVFATGDHADLGAALSSAIPRVRKMRKWSIAETPSQSGRDRHSTLREGPTSGYEFEDQSDDVPQVIRERRYPMSSPFIFQRRYRPHPLLCAGKEGRITVFPDHMHEGEIIEFPTGVAIPVEEWPQVGAYQPRPEIVAWGKIEEPGLNKTGTEFGIVGAYDGHGVNVGRVSVDSTWHHWFDINLIGDNGIVGGNTGFNATPPGKAHLKMIERYFLNTAIWLAPPGKQTRMRNALGWGAIWRDPLFMISPKIPIHILGEHAIDAFGKSAPKCTIYQWIDDLLPIEFRPKWKDLLDRPDPPPPFFEESILGAAMMPMIEEMHKLGRVPEKVDVQSTEKRMNDSFAKAYDGGLAHIERLLDGPRKALDQMRR